MSAICKRSEKSKTLKVFSAFTSSSRAGTARKTSTPHPSFLPPFSNLSGTERASSIQQENKTTLELPDEYVAFRTKAFLLKHTENGTEKLTLQLPADQLLRIQRTKARAHFHHQR